MKVFQPKIVILDILQVFFYINTYSFTYKKTYKGLHTNFAKLRSVKFLKFFRYLHLLIFLADVRFLVVIDTENFFEIMKK